MRTPTDALRDPRPGDVFRVREGVTRISKATDSELSYFYDGPLRDMPRKMAWQKDWRGPWQEYAANAEVLHVAQEGGSHE